MDRRDFIRAIGAGGIATVGAYGAYSALVRNGEPTNISDTPDNETLASDPVPVDTDARTRDGAMLRGVSPRARDVTVLDPFEEWLGEKHAVVGLFIDMGKEDEEIHRIVNSVFESVWSRGQVPHIFWQPFFPDLESTPAEINEELADGEYDDTIHAWADTLSAWGWDDSGRHRRVYLNLAPEFNGDWSPWSPAVGDESEEDFVDMWRHVHDILSDAGLTDPYTQWIWTVDRTTRGVDREACYPGDDYVNWCGIHGYNWVGWEAWQSPAEVYGESIDFLRGLTEKPIAITEFGTSSETEDGGHDPERKAAWISEAYKYLLGEDIRMTLYFDMIKETDWAVFDTEHGTETVEIGGREYRGYSEYKEAVTETGIMGPHPNHPRLLTDTEFAGEW